MVYEKQYSTNMLGGAVLMNSNVEILNNIKSGEVVKVKEVRGGKGVRNKLMEMGIIEGAPIRVMANNGGPLIVLVGNSRFALGRGMAQKIGVNKL
jgi:ferrous iron transport protein A